MSLVERAEALQTEAQELFTQLDLGTAFPWQSRPTTHGMLRSPYGWTGLLD